MNFEDYFSVQIFFIILRETLETAIVISVLLSFINQRAHEAAHPLKDSEIAHMRSLRIQVWAGALLGFGVCIGIGAVFVLAFYLIGENYWLYAERLWEGIFSLLSSVIITVMGIGLLRINRVMKVKWFAKLGDAFDQQPAGSTHRKKYFLALLPFVTTLREGLEAVVFVGGIGLSLPASSLPASILAGIVVGSTVGYTLYKGGNKLSLQYFLILLTCFLYIVLAGLMSRGVWFLELEQYVRRCGGLDVSETGLGPGSYDPGTSVWHVNCCNGLTDGWWMVLNALVGWTNSATYGSVAAYCAYWLLVIAWLEIRLYDEHHGYLPLVPIRWQLKHIRKKVMLYEARTKQGAAVEAEPEAELLME